MTLPGAAARIPVLAAASFATATQSFVFAGMLGEMAHDLSVPVAQAGQLGTVFALAFGLSAPLVASLFARVPRRALIVGALVVLALLNLLIVMVQSFPVLLGLRVLCGIAAAVVVPAASATAAMLAPPEHRGRALAMVIAGTTAAFLFGIPMGSVVGEFFGWHGAFALAGALALGAALLIRLVLPDVAVEAGAGRIGMEALRNPGVAPTLALTFLGFAAVFCFAAYIGPAVNRVSGLTGSGVAIMQMLVGVASLAGVPVGGWLADRHGIRAAVFLPMGMFAMQLGQTALLAGAADGSAWAPYLQGFFILGTSFALFALAPILQSRLVGLVPTARTVVLAGNASALFLGQAAGAGVGGIGIAILGLPGIGVMGATLSVAATAVAWHLRRVTPAVRAAA
ncbi:MFS transporter [Humitalea sp. 24SJ18S-53]|uniref:MFS transporter n=1 Tax=Humitalea sp. 24SJ18S-53 TaxID=3422307 RepID=UPI003D66B070